MIKQPPKYGESRVSFYPSIDGRNESDKKLSPLQDKIAYLSNLIPEYAFKDLLAWTLYVRPTVGVRPNLLPYLTFWHDIYRDTWKWIQILIARQMWKSNYLGSRMAHKMTKRPGMQTLYGTFELESLRVFSKKFRYELWASSPILRQFVLGSTLGSATSLETITNSVAWLTTALQNFSHAESKSTDEQVWDEAQYLDWLSYARAKEAKSFTDGDFCAAGIGGDEDSEYHEMWKSTDQREWNYTNDDVYVDTAGKEWPDQGWRKHLQYDDSGLVWGNYMIKDGILDGNWTVTKPENSNRHGYHLSQYVAPWIPLSKSDAVKLYKKLPEDSIEGKMEEYPQADFIRHVLAGFAKGDIIPFPKSLLYTAYDKRLKLLKPSEVDYSIGKLYAGFDWGGGGRTIGWIYQVTDEQIPVLRLIAAKRMESNDVTEQYEEAVAYMDDYEVDQGVMDAGGGSYQVQQLEKRYGERMRKFSYLKRPGEPSAKDRNEERVWRRENRWANDKTWLMERVKTYLSNPHKEGPLTIKKIILPAFDVEAIEWIVDQFANERTEKIKLDSGGYYTRYFTPDKDKLPDDALHAQNYSIVAWDLKRKRGDGHIGGGVYGDSPDTSSNSSIFTDRYKPSRFDYAANDL